MPTFNRCLLLQRAVDSVRRQSFEDIEIIVCDDGSSDDTQQYLETLSDHRLRVLRQQFNVGMVANMNSGVEAAAGELMLVLSDDDWLELNCVGLLRETWEKHPGLGLCFGQWWYHQRGEKTLQQSRGPGLEGGFEFVEGYLLGRRSPLLNATVFRTSDVKARGGFRGGYAQDAVLTLEMARCGAVAHVRAPCSNYELQPSSATLTIDTAAALKDRAYLLDMAMEHALIERTPRRRAKRLLRQVERRLAYAAVAKLLRLAADGVGAPAIDEEARRLAEFLRHAPFGSEVVALSAAKSIPGPAIAAVRAFLHRS